MAFQLGDRFKEYLMEKVKATYIWAVLTDSEYNVVSNVVNSFALLTTGTGSLTNPEPIQFECAQGAVVYYLKLYSNVYPEIEYLTIPIDGAGGGAFTFAKAGTFTFRANDLNIDIGSIYNTNIGTGTNVDDTLLGYLDSYIDSAVLLNSSYGVVSNAVSIGNKLSVSNSTLTNTADLVFNCADGVTVSHLKLYNNDYPEDAYITVISETQNGDATFSGDGTYTIPAYGLSIDI